VTTPLTDETLGIVLSRYCTAECGHCGSSAGPSRTDRLDRTVLDRALRSAAAFGYQRVAFTGGEPLAHRTLTLEGVGTAHAFGLHTTVCTNAFWADTDDRADALVTALIEAGLDRLQLSTDRWHLDHVDPDRVVLAAEVAAARGLEVQVAIPSGRADWIALELYERFAHIEGVDRFIHPAHAVGRGEFLPAAQLQPSPPRPDGCHLAGHHELDVDGRVSICPTSADFGPHSVLRAGDASLDDLGELVDRSRRRPLVWVIATWGPLGIARLAGRPDPASRSFAHDCQLCRALHSDDRVLADIRRRHGVDLLEPADDQALADVLTTVAELLGAWRQPTDLAETEVRIRC
jgi:hypothetical protein